MLKVNDRSTKTRKKTTEQYNWHGSGALTVNFKACVHYFLTNFYFLPNDSPSKTMKDVFYFI